MTFLLDTNAVIGILAQRRPLLTRMRHHATTDFALSVIVIHELTFGAYGSKRVAANLAELELLAFPVLDFTRQDAQQAGIIRATLASAGTPIGAFDLLIAGQALVRGMTVVTRNVREFSRVEGLRVEDWEA